MGRLRYEEESFASREAAFEVDRARGCGFLIHFGSHAGAQIVCRVL